jgi:hypothetical protein
MFTIGGRMKKGRIFAQEFAVMTIISGFSIGIMLPSPAVQAAPAQVVNPSLEQVSASTPDCFTRAGWGTHDVSWALSNDAHTGSIAQSVTVANYVSGDRKLIITENNSCAPAVSPNTAYTLSVRYKSTVPANALTVFRHSASGWTYWTDLKTMPAAPAWTQVTAQTPLVPAGTDQISFGVSIAGNGTLVTDDYSLSPVTVSPPIGGELTLNGSLEDGPDMPTSWRLVGWGDATVTSGVTADAHSGNRAYALTLAGRTQGDYKLLPTDAAAIAVQPGAKYRSSFWYKATTGSNSVTVFSHTASGWAYWRELQSVPAAAGWTQVSVETPAIPAGVDAIAWGVSLAGNGTLITDDYSTIKSADAPPPPPQPSTQGKWTVLDYTSPVRAVHATLLKNSKVLLIAGSGNSIESFTAGSFKASVWDPVANNFMTMNVPKDMFCSGHVTLPDGRILIQGGTKSYPTDPAATDYGGLRDSWIFDPDTNTFTTTNLANEGHWYPTLTQLGNGDIWMAGGLKEDTTGAVNTERFSVASGQWLPTNQVPQTWKFWGLYPHMFLMQDGRLFYSGGHVFGNGLPGTGASLYNPDTSAVTDVPGLRQKDMRDQSASVLLPPAQDQKVLITGGGNINTANEAIGLTDIIDLKQPNPTYMPGPDLPGLGKMYLNATILPDRTVFVSNGSRLNRNADTNVFTAASYDPATNQWTSMAADPIGRNYHSSALLLSNGKVAVFGSNPGDNSFELRISVYEPTYLFKSARPELSNVPALTSYGQQFTATVARPSSKAIKWAQLVRPMSVTHQTDANMRLVDLPIAVQGNTATLSVPSNRNLLPPGPYMLVVTDTDGVPSIGSWIKVQ